MSAIFQKIVAFIVSILAFLGININIEKPDVDVRGDGYEYSIDFEDREIDIEFPSNPTTGYAWSYKLDGTALVLTKDEYDADDNPFGIAGKGGKQEYEFRAVAPGDVTLEFTYARSGENGDIGNVFVVKINVNANYEISVVSFDKIK